MEDSSDQNVWSGLVYYMRRTLEQHFDVVVYDKIPFECPLPLRIYHQFYKRFSKKLHHLQLEPAILKKAAKRIEKRFREEHCDAVFCPGTGTPVNTFIDRSVPVFSYLDASKFTWINTYFGMNSLSKRSQKILKLINEAGLKNDVITFFSSDWARQAALNEVQVDKNKFVVIPFGANICSTPTIEELYKPPQTVCNILFIGVNWLRKGGDVCYETYLLLKEQGFDCTLTIIGCNPDFDDRKDDSVVVIPFLNKKKEQDLKSFYNYFKQAHFLMLPTKADCTPVVFSEAAAFGLPVITTRIGGIPSVIEQAKNGFMLSPHADENDYAKTIKTIFVKPEIYKNLCASSRAEYEKRLNWNTAGLKLSGIIMACITKQY
jgi:glycosyltransferase involved in cell wall biosynthesis